MKRALFFIFCFIGWSCASDTAEEDRAGNPVSDVTVEVNPLVSTILTVKWKQVEKTDTVRLRFSFEDDEYFESPPQTGEIGEHREVILGVPGETVVTFYVVSENRGEEIQGEAFQGTTGPLPVEMPVPTLVSYDPSIASGDRWNLGSVEDTQDPNSYFSKPFWIYILDRKARVVWYFKDPLDARILFPRVSRDGTHVIFDSNRFDLGSQVSLIRRVTLDFEYQDEIDLENMNWGYDETDGNEIVFDVVENPDGDAQSRLILYERLNDGSVREIWDCRPWADSLGVPELCFSNAVNWSADRNTVLISMPNLDTVLEIDADSGELRSQWGAVPDSWDFDPAGASFDFNHYPTITKDGTFLVSSHIPGGDEPGEHRFMEFEIDEEDQTLRSVWTFGEGVNDWPMYMGEATRMENGNTLVNYGTGGSMREVTPDGRTAWHVLWDADFEDQSRNKLCGHNTFFNDLYALNRGPEE